MCDWEDILETRGLLNRRPLPVCHVHEASISLIDSRDGYRRLGDRTCGRKLRKGCGEYQDNGGKKRELHCGE